METKLTRLVVALATVWAANSALAADIKWEPTYQAAIAKAKSANKLVMIEFYASWDLKKEGAPCYRMENETFAEKDVQAVATKFVPVRLDVDKDGKALVSKFHITNYPTILFVDKKEEVAGIIDGFEDSTEFVKHGDAFLKDYADFAPTEAKYKKNKKNLDAVTRLGVIYADRYQVALAIGKLKEAESLDGHNKTDKLSDLYNAIGDHYQNASKFDDAIPYFQKAADTSKVTDKRAYGYLSIATCYFTMEPQEPGNPVTIKHFKQALPALDACLKLPNLKPADLQLARRMRTTANQVITGNDGG